MRSAALAFMLLVAGCGVDSHAFVCETDAQCGSGGRCEPEGYCSVADATCSETGFRFVESSDPALAGTCTRVCAENVYAGSDATCVRLTSGTVQCFGANATAQLGLGSADGDAHSRPGPAAGIFDGRVFTQLALGAGYACGRGSDGSIACWGKNSSRQATATTQSAFEVAPATIVSGDSVIAGREHACALVSGGVRCWGSNALGQLGVDDAPAEHAMPMSVLRSPTTTDFLGGVTRIASSAAADLACATASGVGCWGDNAYGQLGEGSITQRDYFQPLGGLTSGALPMAVGQRHACIAQRGSTPGVKCWGDNASGQLGNPSSEAHQTPTLSTGFGDVTHLAAQEAATCAVLAGTAEVVCVGAGYSGFETIEGATGATALTAGTAHACVIVDGRVLCWGDNTYGQLGDGTTTSRTVPRVARLVCPRD